MKYCVNFILKDDKVLLLKRTITNPFYPGIWTPVIGKIKINEKPITAILRETKEETNLDLKNPFFVKQCDLNNDEYWIYMSKIEIYNISLNHENDKFNFFEPKNLPKNLWGFFKTEINYIFSN